MSRDPDYVADILEMMNRVQIYIEGMDKEAFLADLKTQDAVSRCIEIIGEATKRLSAHFRSENPHIPWQHMAGMRDILIHAYDSVDLDLVWEAAVTSIPRLRPQIEKLVENPPTAT